MTDEVVEWIDDHGSVLGVVSRRRMRSEVLRHRAVYVVVVRSAGRLVVHRRADHKDVWPGRWDLAFGGVVTVGETWESAARRELAEEAGIDGVALTRLGSFDHRDVDVAVHGVVFRVDSDDPVVPVDGEVAEVAEIPVDGLTAWLDATDVCPDSVAGVVPLLVAPA